LYITYPWVLWTLPEPGDRFLERVERLGEHRVDLLVRCQGVLQADDGAGGLHELPRIISSGVFLRI
jgi:hypothetical protein